MAKNRESKAEAGPGADTEIGELRFEDAAEALETIIDQLERGDVPLEDSLEAWERGRALLTRCREILDQAADRIAEVDVDGDAEESG